MESRFVNDGPQRLWESDEFQARLRELKESVRARYAAELAEAGFFRRLLLRRRIAAEVRREQQRLFPSPYSLYSCRGG